MTRFARLNKDRALELPAALVDARGWQPGAEFEVEETAVGLIIRVAAAPAVREGIDWEEFRRRVPKHEGPPASLEDMEDAIEAGRRERWSRKEASSR